MQDETKVIEIEELNDEISPEYCFKLVIVGDSGVGKTSLVKYEILNSFVPKHNTTIIFEHSWKNYGILGKTFRLQIWDTCGQETYHSLVKSFYRSALCTFIVFSLDDEDSFNQVNKWLDEINSNNVNESIKVLIGNKLDNFQERKISKETIEQFCKEKHIENYYETSAKTGENVHELFKSIVLQLYMKFAVPIITASQNNETPEHMTSITKNAGFIPPQNNFSCKKCLCYNQ